MIKINGQINNQSPISKLIMAIGGIVALGFFCISWRNSFYNNWRVNVINMASYKDSFLVVN